MQVISCRLFLAHADTVDSVALAPTVTLSPFCKTVECACAVLQFNALILKKTAHHRLLASRAIFLQYDIVWRNVHSCSVITLTYLFELIDLCLYLAATLTCIKKAVFRELRLKFSKIKMNFEDQVYTMDWWCSYVPS